jgi:hypothetical protein
MRELYRGYDVPHSLAALEGLDAFVAPVASAFLISAASSSECLSLGVAFMDISLGQTMNTVLTT